LLKNSVDLNDLSISGIFKDDN